jgi:hypothetical protein
MWPVWKGATVILALVVLISGCTGSSVNHTPSVKNWGPKGDTAMAEGTVATFNINASDPDGQKLKCLWYIDGVLNSTQTAPFAWTYSPGRSTGNHTVRAVVSDGSLSAVRIWNVVVYKVNHPPIVSALLPAGGEPPVNEGGALEFRAVVVDPDGDTVALAWLLDGKIASEGASSYLFQPGFDMAGTHLVRLNASDGLSSTEAAWNVTVVNVNRAPRIINVTPQGDPRLQELDTLRFHAEAVDDDTDPVSMAWALDGVSVEIGKWYNFTPDHFSQGGHNVTVTASDGSLEVRHEWRVSVDNLNRPPDIVSHDPSGDAGVSEWERVAFSVEVSDIDGDVLQVGWFVDNSPVPAGNGTVFNYTPGFQSFGNHTVRAVLSDGNASVTQWWNVSVRRASSNWTVLVFMNADNDLEPYLIEDLNEMELAGSTKDVNIVVQMDRHPSYDASNGDWKGARRYRVEKNIDGQLVGSRLLQDMGEVNMGSQEALRDFLMWGLENFPAERFLVVMSGHGDGWTGISQDFSDGNSRLSAGSVVASLSTFVAARGAPVDVLEFDVCYWAMLETDWGLRELASFIVGSEDIDPSPGQSYGTYLGELTARPAMTARELALEAVSSFSAGYAEGMSSPEDNETFTQSAVDTARLGALAGSLDRFSSLLEGNITEFVHAITAARQAARHFGKPEYVDLYDLARLLRQNSTSDHLNASADAVLDGVLQAVVSEFHGQKRAGAHGISIYFPAYSYDYKATYGDLDFSKDNHWCRLLLAYYNATGRGAAERHPPQAAEGHPANAPTQAQRTGTPGRSMAGGELFRKFNVRERY